MKSLSLLGSTGSIGVSTLQVVDAHPERFKVTALGAGRNVDLLTRQVARYRPEVVAVADEITATELKQRVANDCRVLFGSDGMVEVATHPGVDLLVSGLVGAIGLEPTYAAVRAGRDVALANKETLVVAGEQIMTEARRSGARILPVDSEHNAIHQCLRGEEDGEVRRLWLTASGGPFRGASRRRLEQVTPEEALRHPTWKMGPKITVDSATLMNKGLEVIEARWLFGVEGERIRVVVHPTSVVHSMVEFVDGSFKAQLGVTDMRHPIQYALSWPARWAGEMPEFDPVGAGPLEFEKPDMEGFPCLGLAFAALAAGGAAPAALNAANEIAVQAFLDGRARFTDIDVVVGRTMERHSGDPAAGLEDLMTVDRSARATAREILEQGVRS